jgi:leucyl-tRNA synthetase
VRYEPNAIEGKWQEAWAKAEVFKTPETLAELKNKPKYYVLDMFPYPSGSGLHVGHPEGYTATDVVARMKRMQGFNVLHPMGWDAFGLPAERAAERDNIHPAIITTENIANFKRQINRLGFSYDWNREISTTDPQYYKFTQLIFLKLYEKDLAYLAEVAVNWCPALSTVLANEEVKDGRYVETGDLVEKRVMRQWMLRITAYGDRLLEDLSEVDWPEGVKEMQRNWIGRSDGLLFTAPVKGTNLTIQTFSAHFESFKADTFVAIAPDHPLLPALLEGSSYKDEVLDFCEGVLKKRQEAGRDDDKEVEGFFTGRFIVDPVGNGELPIWVANFVLKDYGTGIVKCSAHDERDFRFAKKYNIPLKAVLFPKDAAEAEKVARFEVCYTDMTHGILHEPPEFAGKVSGQSREAIIAHCVQNKLAAKKTSYKLRDWLFSRQRYWGEPFPILHADDGSVIPMLEQDLPLTLPMIDAYKPTDDGRPPLARASSAWLNVTLPDGRKAVRETNTMPQWAGSCWYYLRYIDSHNEKELCSKELENYWMPVDLYIGGVEHAVLHLLYARFWHKVLYDCGVVHTKEPFQKLFNQGMILGQSYQDAQGKYYYAQDIETRDGKPFAKSTGREVKTQTEKMSKSRYNVISPDDVIDSYGADAMRLYELFMGPLDQVKMWQMAGVEGVYRFLQRTWRLLIDEESGAVASTVVENSQEPAAVTRSLHKTIKKVSEDTAELKFNTAISQMMIFMNEATAAKAIGRSSALSFLSILSPYAPHIAEELWSRMGASGFACQANWPSFDASMCEDDEIVIVVQVNGKRRDEMRVSKSASSETIQAQALELELVKKFMNGLPAKKIVVVPSRLVNIVV